MLKFFRKIRQNLIKENKASKYLLYAIGEIFLVVIGILIALQLNTWKEERQNTQVEINYLKGILTNLDQDIYNIETSIAKDTTQFFAYTEILKPFITKNYKLYTPDFINAIKGVQGSHDFSQNTIVFEDMKSSGKINLIKSDVLRLTILKHYNESEQSLLSIQGNITSILEKLGTVNKVFDLNSLVEGFLFPKQWSAELDPLDLSFFKKDKNDLKVKEFANTVSLMKGLLLSNHNQSLRILKETNLLKKQIKEYFVEQNIQVENTSDEVVINAIRNGDIDTLSRLISDDTINSCFYQGFEYQNYLVVSISLKSIEALKFFVEKGANLEATCAKKTPLMYAVKYGELEMVKYLLDKGANINAINKGNTVLNYAQNYKHPEIEKYLKEFISKNN